MENSDARCARVIEQVGGLFTTGGFGVKVIAAPLRLGLAASLSASHWEKGELGVGLNGPGQLRLADFLYR